MDVFTHFAVPYLLLWLLRRPQAERLAAGLGGYAPDLDVLTGWIGLFGPEWEFMGHRGASHSLVGAPLYAVGAMALVSLPPWERRFPRMAVWRFTPALVGIAMLGSLTHLALDAVTVWGIPLLFPFAVERVGLDWFSYSVVPALLVSIYLAYRLARGTASDRVLRTASVLLVVAFAASGATRALTHPDVPEGALTRPGSLEWEWRSFEQKEGGWEVTSWSFGRAQATRFFAEDVPDDPAARAAVEVARGTADYRSFLMYAGGPIVVLALPDADAPDAWRVTFLDLMARAQIEEEGDRRGAIGEWGVLHLLVDARGARPADPVTP